MYELWSLLLLDRLFRMRMWALRAVILAGVLAYAIWASGADFFGGWANWCLVPMALHAYVAIHVYNRSNEPRNERGAYREELALKSVGRENKERELRHTLTTYIFPLFFFYMWYLKLRSAFFERTPEEEQERQDVRTHIRVVQHVEEKKKGALSLNSNDNENHSQLEAR